MSIQYLDLEGGANNNSANPFDFLAPENNEQQLWAEVYIKQFPDASEFEEMTPEEQREIVAELRDEVELLEEEANVMVHQAENLRIPRTQGLGGGGLNNNNNNNNTTTAAAAIPSSTSTRKSVSAFLPSENPAAATDESTASESAIAVSSESAAPSLPNSVRRGQAYSRKSVDTGDLYVTLEDRVTLLMRERDRMRQQRERDEREGDHLRELLKATVEEAVSRTQELRLDILQFNREVLNEGSDTASSDDLLRYMERRFNAQRKYLDKLNAQSAAAERSILQSQQHLRQRHAAGEAFHAIDFEQLRIENQQFTERIERKNLELVELKGTSTRTVQTLNTLMDTLNALTAEQNRLRKDYKSRCEYLARLQREVDAVAHEADIAERKNAVIKAQHEAVRVPKIEHYVAQKAEEYELRRAERNWKRKVEIAEGQLELTQQQIRVLARATDSTRGRGKRMPRRRITNTTGSSYTNRSSQISTVTAVYTDAGAEPEKSSPSGPPSIEAEKALLGLKKSQSIFSFMLRRQSSGPVLKSQPSPSCIHTEDDEVIREPSQNGSNHTNALGILVAVRIRPFTRQEKQWELKKQDDKEFDERHFLEPIVDVDNDGKTITLLDPTNRGVSKTKFNFEYVISSIAPSVEVDIFDDMNHEPMLPSPPPKQEIESQEGQAQYRRKGLLNGSPIMLTGENSDEEAELEQEKLFQALGVPLVDWSLRGFNACIFAYGQTGSGKTYTMMGNQSHEGLIPRVTRHLFNSIAEQATGQQRPHENEDLSIPGSPSGFSTSSKGEDGSSYNLTPSASPPTTGETPTVCLTKVTISFMEIHNERVWDLLKLERRKGWNGAGVANNNYNSRWDPDPSECYEVLKVRQHPIQGPFVEGLTTVDVSSWEECQKYINHGNSVRAHSCTSGNENSSRSHAIFQMVVTQTISLGGRVRGKEVTTQRVSKINLVDLAGSERNTNADVKGKHFTEANAINLSLSVLRRVITALVNRSKVVPYRESLLTYVLSDNFGGNSRTVMCANISPHISKFSETESTLRYAALARGVVNQVRVNEHPLAKVIRELRDRMRRLQEELRQSVEGGGEGKEKEVEVERVSELEARIARHAETLAEVRQRERDLCALVREARRRERDLRADLRRRREEGRRWRREAQRQREAKVRLLTALRDVARENPQLQLPGDVPITTSDTEDVDEIVNAEDEEEEEEEEEQEYGEEDLVDLGDDKIVECLGSGEGEGEEKEKKMNGVKGVHLPLTVRNRPASSSQLPRIAQTKVDESPFKNIDFTQRPQKKGQKEKQQQQPLNVDRLSEGGIKVSSAPPVIGKGRGGKTIKKGNSGNNKDSSTTECVIPHPPLLRRAGSDTVRPSSGILRPSQCAVPLSLQPSDDSEKEMGRHSSNDSPECVLAINGVNPHIIKGISLGGGRSPTPPLLQNHISPSSPPKRKKKNNRNDNISVDTILDIQTDFIVGENNSDKENHKRSLVNRPPPLHPRRLVETPFSKPESILSKKTPNSNSSNGSNPQKAYNRENGVVHNNLALLKKRDAVVVQRSTPLDKTRAMVRKG